MVLCAWQRCEMRGRKNTFFFFLEEKRFLHFTSGKTTDEKVNGFHFERRRKTRFWCEYYFHKIIIIKKQSLNIMVDITP